MKQPFKYSSAWKLLALVLISAAGSYAAQHLSAMSLIRAVMAPEFFSPQFYPHYGPLYAALFALLPAVLCGLILMRKSGRDWSVEWLLWCGLSLLLWLVLAVFGLDSIAFGYQQIWGTGFRALIVQLLYAFIVRFFSAVICILVNAWRQAGEA